MKNSKKNNIVFLPGFGFSAKIWQKIAKHYGDFETHLLDLPTINAATKVEDIAQQLIFSIPKNTILVGWSLGGLLAIYFCAQFPNHCQKLILTSSTPKFMADQNWTGIDSEQSGRFRDNAIHQPDQLIEDFMRIVCFPDRNIANRNFIKSHEMKCHVDYLNILLNTDARSLYQSLDLPISIIQGDKDVIVSSHNISQLTALNVQASVEIIEGAGHAPFVTHEAIFLKSLNKVVNNNASFSH
jgi:pimeloyl-[acyl-carrier protein] methyl ester esterase